MAEPVPKLFSSDCSRPGIVVGRVEGEVDLHNSPSLRGEINHALKGMKTEKLVLNLSKVPYMDSSGIAVLVETLKELRKVGGKLVLTELQPRVRGVLEIARLDSIFHIAADDQAAM